MATASSIKAMFPEFANMSDNLIEIYITNSQVLVNRCLYGNYYELALSYLTAHMLKIANDKGKELSSETVDKLSRSYATTNGTSLTNNSYLSTTYGKMYQDIRKKALSTIRPLYAV